MNKLSKEQAEWLICNLREKTWGICNDDRNMTGVNWEDVKSLINQCTEKEFPEFKGSYKDGPSTIGDIILQQHSFNADYTQIMLKDFCVGHNQFQDIVANFTNDQFKDFATGANKIVEYLND